MLLGWRYTGERVVHFIPCEFKFQMRDSLRSAGKERIMQIDKPLIYSNDDDCMLRRFLPITQESGIDKRNAWDALSEASFQIVQRPLAVFN